MYSATLTFRNPLGSEHVSVIEHERQDMFYAMVTGAASGGLYMGTVLVSLVIDKA